MRPTPKGAPGHASTQPDGPKVEDGVTGRASRELCGCRVEFGGYETSCLLVATHVGRCLPRRSDVMRYAEALERQAQDIYAAVAAQDANTAEPWPYEGPSE